MTSFWLQFSLNAGLLHEVLNHLWQSTVFAGGIALVMLLYRSSPACVRFWLWAAASAKFVVPFSALVWIGRNLGWSAASPATLSWSFALEEVSRPFTSARVLRTVAQPGLANAGWEAWLAGIWAAGLISVLAAWVLGWYRMKRLAGKMEPVTEGPAFEILRRLEARAGVSRPLRLMTSESSLEPGVFGIVRPALVLPAGVLQRLSPAQLEAIVRHELCHVMRRDNLIAFCQMVIQALFWFHPLTWWLGARLMEERERACDEAVLDQMREPQVYAQGILKVCEYYVESTMPCIAGVTGAGLRRRIENIMTEKTGNPLNFGRRLMLWAGGVAAIAGPIAVGLMDAPRLRAQSAASGAKEFEVASIKPMDPAMGGMMRVEIQMAPGGRFVAKGLNLKMLIQQAYGVRDFQISGAPPWASTDRYEINAKGPDGNITRDELRPMLQGLLADRFQLKLKRETKEMPVYHLVVAKGGPKLTESQGDGRDQIRMGRGMVQASSAALATIANQLSNQLGRSVIDKTGLTGRYDFKLEWTPDESQNAQVRQMHPDAPPAPPLDSSGPSIFTALQEQLGLKLENSKGPVEILVIERVEKPSAN